MAAPSQRPLFAGVRRALTADLDLQVEEEAWERLAPEALLSRLSHAGIDIGAELRVLLGGGSPNALHVWAAEVLESGNAVWTTNFDELIEEAARSRSVQFHRLLPDQDPGCRCSLGHLVKVHGTLSSEDVLARSEQVLTPLRAGWLQRLNADLAGATVALLGYAGADIDLRAGLRSALEQTDSAVWFGTEWDRETLERRFKSPLSQGLLKLDLSERPDLVALEWAAARGYLGSVPPELLTLARAPLTVPQPKGRYRVNDLVRARLLDDFGRVEEARRHYRRSAWRGPRRLAALQAVYSSGMIHGSPWRPVVLTVLDGLCALPVRWHWPHRQRLSYLTWNFPPDERLRILERSLVEIGSDPQILLSAANAAKEVNPQRAVEIGERAQREAMERAEPANVAWATFVLSLAQRWLGDLRAAEEQAERLADGFDALAGPVWIGWGAFEQGAIAALKGDPITAVDKMREAASVFTSSGSMFAFDAWCGVLAAERAAGNKGGQVDALGRAQMLMRADDRRRRFKREVLLVEEAELARQAGKIDEAEHAYSELSQSPTAAQKILGLLGWGEVQVRRGAKPEAAWRALHQSDELGFGYGQVHAAITLGLAGEMAGEEAELKIAASVYDPPARADVTGLHRFCQGVDSDEHLLCFP